MSSMSLGQPTTLRPFETRQDCLTCVALQREIWGQDFIDVVPATILMVCQRVGGVAAGAFDANSGLLGFVFGLSGVTDGALSHWSDMLAVRPAARRRGLGRRLKLYQRRQLLDRGIRTAYWSYDPLVARNARFNLSILGARPTEYVVDMYGDTHSTLHHGLDTDRVIVKWQLDDPDVECRAAGETPLALPDTVTDTQIVNLLQGRVADPPPDSVPMGDWVRIAIPVDIDTLKSTDPDQARRWQQSVRPAFSRCLTTGYRVVGFVTNGEAAPFYVLTTQPWSGQEG